MLPKDLTPRKIKTAVVFFILNHINSPLIIQKIDLDM